jgi:hypothetical protein
MSTIKGLFEDSPLLVFAKINHIANHRLGNNRRDEDDHRDPLQRIQRYFIDKTCNARKYPKPVP